MKEQNHEKMIGILPKEKNCLVLLENFYTEFGYADNMFFLDTLSKRKGTPCASNCILLDKPDIKDIKKNIDIAIAQYGCNSIAIDNIFALLSYHRIDEILHFVNDVNSMRLKNIYFNIKREINETNEDRLIKDLSLLADETFLI
jgi:hypothetical protein